MKPYIPEVEKLSKMDSGLDFALELIRYLGNKSYIAWSINEGASVKVPFSARRESDGPAVELYANLLRKKKVEDPGFIPESEFKDLVSQRKLFSFYDEAEKEHSGFDQGSCRPISDSDTYFPNSQELMWRFIQGL